MTAVLSEADTMRPVNSPHRPSITASLEDEPRGEASPPSAAASRVANGTTDSADGTEELSSIAPPPADDTSHRTVQSPAFIEGDTFAGISAPSRDLSTNHAEENPNEVPNTQKHAEFDGFDLEDTTNLLRIKRLPHT
jgi:hypothetical protein